MRVLWILVGGLLLLPAVALAVDTSSTSTTSLAIGSAGDAISLFRVMAAAFSGGAYAAGAGAAVALLVAVLRYVKALDIVKLPDAWDKWVALGLAMASSIAGGLWAGHGWWDILSTGVQAGVYAIGGWELLLKPLRNKLVGKSKIGVQE